MKSLKRKEDVKASKEAAESESGRHFLKIPGNKTPWRLLSLDYEDGYTHWVPVQGRKINVACVGGVEGKGFDPDNCPICKHTLELYDEAKALKAEGRTKEAKIATEDANDMRAKYQALFIAVKGQKVLIKERTKDGKIRKAWAADFDTESEDSEVEVGVLGLTKSQFSNLIGLIGSEETPFVKTGSDLGNRVLWSTKKSQKGRKGNSDYTEVLWSADAKPSSLPEIEIPDNVSVEGYFDVDEKTLSKVTEYLTGEATEDIPIDDAVEAEEEDAVEETEVVEDAENSEDETEDDFDDDIPWEETDEEEEVKPKRKVKKSRKARI